MIIFYCCAAALVALAAILRRRLARLAQLKLRHVWLIWAALAVQVLVISVVPGHNHVLLAGVHLASYAAAAAFAWLNRKIAGALPIFAGGATNLAAIAANGGTMPASAAALRASGWHAQPGHFANSAVVAHAHLSLLGDIFATPSSLPGHDVFSIGDVLIIVGFVAVVWRNCADRRPVGDSSHLRRRLVEAVRQINASLLALDDRLLDG